MFILFWYFEQIRYTLLKKKTEVVILSKIYILDLQRKNYLFIIYYKIRITPFLDY